MLVCAEAARDKLPKCASVMHSDQSRLCLNYASNKTRKPQPCMLVHASVIRLRGMWCVYSEYRQAEGSVVSAVAQRLLTTDAPSETTQDLAASAQQVSTTGAAAAALRL